MSSSKRKLESDDLGNDDSSPSKKTKTTKISSKSRKRSKSTFERQFSSGESSSDFGDDADRDPDWLVETSSHCLPPEDPDEDDGDHSMDNVRKWRRKLQSKTEKKKGGPKVAGGKKKKERVSKRTETFICHICEKELSSVVSLNQHLKSHNRNKRGAESASKQETCDLCLRVIVDLESHKKGHDRDESVQSPSGLLKCMNCLKCYDDSGKLGYHRRSYCPLNATGEDTKCDTDWLGERSSQCWPPDEDDGDHSIDNMKKGRRKSKKKNEKKAPKVAVGKKRKDGVPKGTETFICQICEKETTSLLSLNQHLKRHNCVLCLRITTNLELHKKGHDKDQSSQSRTGAYKCRNCLKCYDYLVKLNTHRLNFCPLNASGEDTNCEDDEGNRMEKQGQKEVWKCDNCNAKFKSVSEFQAHSVIHLEQSKSKQGASVALRCPKCNKIFKYFHLLKIHYESVHINKGACIYKCNICQKRYDHKSKVKAHRRDVHGKAALKCHYCCKVFETKVGRRVHESSEHSENNICEYCGKVVRTKSSFYGHRRRCHMNPNRKQRGKKDSTSHSCEPSSNCNKSLNVDLAPSAEEPQQPRSLSIDMHRQLPSERYHVCQKCCLSFEKRSNYLIHKQSCQLANDVLEEGTYKNQWANLRREVYICNTCNEIFPTELSLCAHESVHQMLICEGCNESMPGEECLLLHVLLECPDRYKHFSSGTENKAARYALKVCQNDKPMVSGFEVEKTVEVPSSKIIRKPILRQVCNICNRKVTNLKRHVTRHEEDQQRQNETGQHECPYCQKCYNNIMYLSSHKLYLCHTEALSSNLVSTVTKACNDTIDTSSPEEVKSSKPVLRETNAEDETSDVTSKVDDKAVEPEGDSRDIESDSDALIACSICREQFDNAELPILHEMVHLSHCVAKDLEEESNGDSDAENEATIDEDTQKTSGLDGTEKDNMDIKCGVAGETQLNHAIADMQADGRYQDTEETVKICRSCDVEFSSTEALKKHKKRVSMLEAKYPSRCPSCIPQFKLISSACEYLQHKQRYRFMCQFCRHHFESIRLLQGHIMKCHDYEDRKECSGCHSVFGPQMYKQHVEYNRKEVERLHRKCLSCGTMFNFTNLRYLNQYINRHTNHLNKNKCNVCSRHFSSSNLIAHKQQIHNVTTLSKQQQTENLHFQCKHCDQNFQKSSWLSAHVKNELEKEPPETRLLCSWEYRYSTCLHCGMTFTKHSDWKMHKSLWKYECVLCSAHFMSSWTFKSHQHTHTYKQDADEDMRMFTMSQYLKCKYCGHGFDSEAQKRKHEFKTSGNHIGPSFLASTHEFPCACEECGEILTSICQLDIHMTRHKQAAIVSCRYCHTGFTRLSGSRSFDSHATKVDENYSNCSVCGLKFVNKCHKRMHAKKHHNEERRERSVGKVEKSASMKSECSVCNEEFPSCEPFMSEHRKHVEKQIVGKVCAFCRVTISQSDYDLHQRLTNSELGLLCSCGGNIQAKCQKKLHDDDKFVCNNCGSHFGTYQDLVRHLVESNSALLCRAGPDKNESNDSGRSNEKVLIKVQRWDTVEKNGKTIYACLYCRDEVETEEEKDEHQSTFKYECPQCRKHYRSSLAAIHHFRNVEHVTEYSKKYKYRKKENDILAVYLERSVCDQVKQAEKKTNELTLEKEPTTGFHIGSEEYSLVTKVIEEATLDDCVEITSCIEKSETAEGSARNVESSATMSSRTQAGKTSNVDKTALQNMKYRCPHCKKAMTMWAFTQHHLDSNNKGLLHTCLICDASFDMECGFEYHMKYVCKHCGAHFDNVEAKCEHKKHCRILGEECNVQTSGGNATDAHGGKVEESCSAERINITNGNPSHNNDGAQTEKDNETGLSESHDPERQIWTRKRKNKKAIKHGKEQKGDIKKHKCDVCTKKGNSSTCYQDDESPKWMTCVCLYCNMELPTRWHITHHFNKNRYHRCRNKHCRKHFDTFKKKKAHTCISCEICTEMRFDSLSDLEIHTSKWHNITYKPIPVTPLTESYPMGSKEQGESAKVASAQVDSSDTLSADEGEWRTNVSNDEDEAEVQADIRRNENEEDSASTLAEDENEWTSKVYSDEEDPGMEIDLDDRNRDDEVIKDEASHHEQVDNQGASELIQRFATVASQSNLTSDYTPGTIQIHKTEDINRHRTEVNQGVNGVGHLQSRQDCLSATIKEEVNSEDSPTTSIVAPTLPVTEKRSCSTFPKPITTTDILFISSATSKGIQAKPPANAMMSLPLNPTNLPSISVIPQKDTTTASFASQNDASLADANEYFTPVAGGLRGLAAIISAKQNSSVKQMLLTHNSFSKGSGFYVKVFHVDHQQYLVFNHPAGVFRKIEKQKHDLKYTVTLMANDKNSETLKGGEIVTGEDALVVKVVCKNFTVKTMNPKCGLYVYTVELVVNELPVTKQVSLTLPVTTKLPVTTTMNSTSSDTNKMTSAKPPATKIVSVSPNKMTSAKPPATEMIRLIPQRATSGMASTSSLTPQACGSLVHTNTSKYFCPVAGGLRGLADIIYAARNGSATKTVVAPDKGNGYFVECFTVNHQQYLAFNHPANRKGLLLKLMNNDLKFAVAILPNDQNSEAESADAFVVRIDCKKCEVKAFNRKPGEYEYIVDLRSDS